MSQCILFDCDGTLVDSEGLCNRALAQQFATLGVTLDTEWLVSHFRGQKLDITLAALATEYRLQLPDSFIPDYRARVAQLFDTELQATPGMARVLAQLPQARAVVSSGPPAKIRHALALSQLAEYFGERIYSSYEVGIWKPEPGIYLHAARDMGFAPRDCVVVEDSRAGLEAGLRAGMRTLFYNPLGEPSPFADAVSFSAMQELPGLLAGP